MADGDFDTVVRKNTIYTHGPLNKPYCIVIVDKLIDSEREGRFDSAYAVQIKMIEPASSWNIILLNDGVGGA